MFLLIHWRRYTYIRRSRSRIKKCTENKRNIEDIETFIFLHLFTYGFMFVCLSASIFDSLCVFFATDGNCKHIMQKDTFMRYFLFLPKTQKQTFLPFSFSVSFLLFVSKRRDMSIKQSKQWQTSTLNSKSHRKKIKKIWAVVRRFSWAQKEIMYLSEEIAKVFPTQHIGKELRKNLRINP